MFVFLIVGQFTVGFTLSILLTFTVIFDLFPAKSKTSISSVLFAVYFLLKVSPSCESVHPSIAFTFSFAEIVTIISSFVKFVFEYLHCKIGGVLSKFVSIIKYFSVSKIYFPKTVLLFINNPYKKYKHY